jgi:thioesterase domain-containing protein
MSSPTRAFAESEKPEFLAREIEQYLHRNIPLCAAMSVHVQVATPRRVELAAPLAPNINHQSTVFGGSASAVAMLSAWTLVHLGLRHEGIDATTVIQRNAVRYQAPMHGDFIAVCTLADEAAWQHFVKCIERHGRGRISLKAHLLVNGRQTASFEGDFAALRR